MTDDRRNERRPSNAPRKKNPTFAIGAFIVIVVLMVIGTLLFNAIREKREFDAQNTPAPASDTHLTVPALGASAAK